MNTPAPVAAKWAWWSVFIVLTGAMLANSDDRSIVLAAAPSLWSMWLFMGLVVLFARQAYPPRASHWAWMVTAVAVITVFSHYSTPSYDWSGEELSAREATSSRSSLFASAIRLAIAGSVGLAIARSQYRGSGAGERTA